MFLLMGSGERSRASDTTSGTPIADPLPPFDDSLGPTSERRTTMPLFTTKPRPRIRLTIVPALLTFCFLPPFADRAPAQRTDRWTAGPIVRDSPDNWAPVRGTDRWTVGPIVKDPPEDRASSRPVEGQAQVHVLLLIDTHAHKIGNGADASGRNMENVLHRIYVSCGAHMSCGQHFISCGQHKTCCSPQDI